MVILGKSTQLYVSVCSMGLLVFPGFAPRKVLSICNINVLNMNVNLNNLDVFQC